MIFFYNFHNDKKIMGNVTAIVQIKGYQIEFVHRDHRLKGPHIKVLLRDRQ